MINNITCSNQYSTLKCSFFYSILLATYTRKIVSLKCVLAREFFTVGSHSVYTVIRITTAREAYSAINLGIWLITSCRHFIWVNKKIFGCILSRSSEEFYFGLSQTIATAFLSSGLFCSCLRHLYYILLVLLLNNVRKITLCCVFCEAPF